MSIEQCPLLHNSGGPPISRLTWDGLASTGKTNGSTPDATGHGGRSDGHSDTRTDPAASSWLTVWAKRRWLSGVPKSEGSDSAVLAKLDALALHLVQQDLLPPIGLISLEKPVRGLAKTVDSDWLLWVLKAKCTSHVWMLSRSSHLGHIGKRCVDRPCPDPEVVLFPSGQGPIWIHLRHDAIARIEACLHAWEGTAS